MASANGQGTSVFPASVYTDWYSCIRLGTDEYGRIWFRFGWLRLGTVRVDYVRWQRRLCLSWCSLSSTKSGEPNVGCQLPPRVDREGTHRSVFDAPSPGDRWVSIWPAWAAPSPGNLTLGASFHRESTTARSGFTRCVAFGVRGTLLWGNPSGEASPCRSDPRTWELAAPTTDASRSLCLPYSTNLWQSSEEEAMRWWGLWWGPPAPTFWGHACRPSRAPHRCDPDRRSNRTAPSRSFVCPYIPSAKRGEAARVARRSAGVLKWVAAVGVPLRTSRQGSCGVVRMYDSLQCKYFCGSLVIKLPTRKRPGVSGRQFIIASIWTIFNCLSESFKMRRSSGRSEMQRDPLFW